MAGIYIIENNVNGMVYVGKSEVPERRFKEHLNALRKNRHSNHLLQNDYCLYGEDSFTFMEIDTYDETEFCWKELEWIQYYRSNNLAPIYNDLGQKIENIDIEADKRLVDSFREGLKKQIEMERRLHERQSER